MREKLRIRRSDLHVFEDYFCVNCKYSKKYCSTCNEECNVLGELLSDGESNHVTVDSDDRDTKDPVCDKMEVQNVINY